MMRNYVKQTTNFLTQLINLYELINKQIKKIPSITPNPHQLSLLVNQMTASNCIDRQVRRQHELQLFKETLKSIQKYVKKDRSIKRCDIAGKYSAVCQVLVTRLGELIRMPNGLKDNIMEHIETSREQFLIWAQNTQKKQTIQKTTDKVSIKLPVQKGLEQPSKQMDEVNFKVRVKTPPPRSNNTKQTDNYVLKYVFTETTQPTTNFTSLKNSPTTTPNLSTQRYSHKKKSKIAYSKTNTELFTKTFTEKQTNKVERKSKRLSKIAIQQSSLKQMIAQPTPAQQISKDISLSSLSISKDNKQEILDAPIPKQSSTKIKKVMTICNRLDNNQQMEYNEQIQSKKSQYFISQNYIRSKKNIDSVNMIANKLKKQSIGFDLLSKDLSECYQPSQESGQQDMVVQGSLSRYRSRKYFTKKYIANPPSSSKFAKSEKFLTNSTNISLRDLLKNNKSLKKRTFRKRQSSLLIKNVLKRSQKIILDDDQIPNTYFNHNKGWENSQTSVLDNKQDSTKQKTVCSLADMYNELKIFRSNISNINDPWLKDFSVFFKQQQKVGDEHSKMLQSILSERKTKCVNEQFAIRKQISHKQVSSTENYHQSAYLMAMRNHLTECTPLHQFGPVIDPI